MKLFKTFIVLISISLLFSTSLTEVNAESVETNALNLLMVPLDDRPANIYFPEQVAKTAGVNLLIPPKDMIGYYLDAGDGDKIGKWVLENGDKADGFVISVSMLAYGGLIASRTGEQSHEAALENIQIIKTLKEKYPEKPVYVYDTIQRLAVTSSSPEFAVYYGQIREWAILVDKVNNFTEFESDRARLEELESQIPVEVMEDYMQARNRNHEVNKTLIDWTKEGFIDNLILAQDDAAEYGVHRAERELLVNKVSELQIGNKVSIYPGADEVDVVFVGRFVSQLFNESPRFYIEYSGRHGSNWIPPLEDITFDKNAIEHIISSGGQVTNNESDADIHIIFNTPSDNANERAADIANTVNRIKDLLDANKTVAIADVANVNKADQDFVMALSKHIDITQLLAYTGWNTAGNTMGITVGHSVSRYSFMEQSNGINREQFNNAAQAHYEFLLHRFSKDQGYSNVVKAKADALVREIGAQGTDLAEHYDQINNFVRENTIKETEEWFTHFEGKRVYIGSQGDREFYSIIKNLEDVHVQLPWPRTFEAELEPLLHLEIDVNELEELYYEIIDKNLDSQTYTKDSWASLIEALNIAEGILSDGNATEEIIEETLMNLQAAYDGLSENIIDKEKLQWLLTQLQESNLIESDYTIESWNKLLAALDKAHMMLDNSEVTQEELDKALEDLKFAMDNLTLVEKDEVEVNKKELISVVEKHESKVESNYTTDSWSRFVEALEKAKLVIEDNDATQADVDHALKELKKADDKLVLFQVEDSDNDIVKENSNGHELPRTATNLFNYGFIGIGIILLGLIILLFTRKNRVQ